MIVMLAAFQPNHRRRKVTLSRTQNIKYGCLGSEIDDGIAVEYGRLGEEEPLTHSISLVPEQQVSLTAPITILRRMEQNEHSADVDPVHNVWSSNKLSGQFYDGPDVDTGLFAKP
jgi:hypothetical protein